MSCCLAKIGAAITAGSKSVEGASADEEWRRIGQGFIDGIHVAPDNRLAMQAVGEFEQVGTRAVLTVRFAGWIQPGTIDELSFALPAIEDFSIDTVAFTCVVC